MLTSSHINFEISQAVFDSVVFDLPDHRIGKRNQATNYPAFVYTFEICHFIVLTGHVQCF